MKTLRELRNKISFDKNMDSGSSSSNIGGSSSNSSGTTNKRSSGNFNGSSASSSPSSTNIDYNIPTFSNIQNIEWKSISSVEKIDFGNSNIFLLITFNNNNNNNNINNLNCNCVNNSNICNNNNCINNNNNNTNDENPSIINNYNESQILLKSSSTIAHDVYAYVLEGILKYPIPEMRLLDFSNLEYTEMSYNLLNHSKDDQSLNDFIKSELEKSFFLILEYRNNGKRFNELNHKEYFSGSKGGKKFKQLGKIIAFDIFCNNFCKLPSPPLNWNSSTFFSNILCYDSPDKNGWYFSLINSNISFLNTSPFTIGYRDHLNRLKLLLFSIFQNPSTESVQIKLMRDHLLKCQGIKLSGSSVSYLQKGIAKGIKSIVNCINFTVLENTKEKVKNIVKLDNNNIWKKSIDSIYCPFLLDVLNEIVIEFANYREKTYFIKA
ncbi:hypothetical protein ACTFIR_005062 [Dictyostelium discoideum]